MKLTPINVGYACINLNLQADKVMTNRGMIKKTFAEKGIAYASELALKNIRDLLTIVDWNIEHGFGLFRMSSDMFPWASEYRLAQLPDFTEIRATLEEIGRRPIRLTIHPGPFNHLAGQGNVLNNTLIDLEYQSELFDLMGLKPSHWNKINIHAGGTYGDKAATLARFAKNFGLLSENLRARLTVENDDRQSLYTVDDLLFLHEEIDIPIVFDYFHHSLNPGQQTEEEAFLTAHNTWDVRPVFHFSDSRRVHEDPTARREAHADWLYSPVVNTYGKDVDIVFECKMKEKAVMKMMNHQS